MEAPTRVAELTRILVAILLITLLLVGCFIVLRPFLPGLLWGAVIAVASWPIMLRVQAWLGGRRVIAALVMTCGFLLCILVPLIVSITTVATHGDEVINWLVNLHTRPEFAQISEALRKLPYVGERLAEEWQRLQDAGLDKPLRDHGRELSGWALTQAGSVGAMFFHFAMSLVAAAGFFLRGEEAAAALMQFAHRLAGPRGRGLVRLAGDAVRAVAAGIVITALLQSLIGGLGLLLAGVPFVGVLTSMMMMLCLAQLGPSPILLPAAIWLFWKGQIWQGSILAVFAIAAVSLDNVLRPFLIRRGANMPMVLILTGVIGGLVGFGLVGLFIGPVLLALAWTLIRAWVQNRIPQASDIECEAEVNRS